MFTDSYMNNTSEQLHNSITPSVWRFVKGTVKGHSHRTCKTQGSGIEAMQDLFLLTFNLNTTFFKWQVMRERMQNTQTQRSNKVNITYV